MNLNDCCLLSDPRALHLLLLAQGRREGPQFCYLPQAVLGSGLGRAPGDPSLAAVARTSVRKRP